MMRPPRSLQGRLVALVLAAVAAVWLATGALTWFDARHELDELLDSHLAQAAAILVAQQVDEIDDDHRVEAPALHRYASKVAFQVFRKGRLALRSANAPAEPMLAPGTEFRRGFATMRIDGETWRVFAAYGAKRNVQVFVGEQVDSRASILRTVLRGALWPMALSLPVLALAIWWAVQRGTAPLHRLARLLSERRPEALHPVEIGGLTSEMTPMVDALNSLFERIATLLESERRFTADAAHELRTPIAAIRAQAQVALAETDDTLRRHALQSTLEGCDRAARLVDQLLTLSRLETDAAPLMEKVDLRALLQRVVAGLAPRALEKRQRLEVDAPNACHVRGNETLLGALVRNLIDNAVRYSPPGAQVRIELEQHPTQFILRVEDSGPGLTEANRRRLGERFFRMLGTDETGSGLGWSIVRRIAAAHRLEVEVTRSARLGGLAVTVTGQADGENG